MAIPGYLRSPKEIHNLEFKQFLLRPSSRPSPARHMIIANATAITQLMPCHHLLIPRRQRSQMPQISPALPVSKSEERSRYYE